MNGLSQRKLKILSAVIEIYVKTGEPVGSKLLCEALDFSVSSATVRNEMAELSELGLLEQPHTSSGRIPSSQGYRFYINEIMNPTPISDEEQRLIYGNLNSKNFTSEELLHQALKILAEATNLVAISTSPRETNAVVNGIQIVQTGKNSGILVFMISSSNVVTKRFRCDYELNSELIRIYNNVINQIFRGVVISSINEDFIRKVLLSIGELSIILSPVLRAVLDATKEALETQILLQGQTNLLFLPGFDLTSAKQTLDFLSRKEDILEITKLDDLKTKILIGGESQRPELIDSSIILSKYFIGDKKSGIIGVIGPTRMDYAKTISRIRYFANTIGELLDGFSEDEEF